MEKYRKKPVVIDDKKKKLVCVNLVGVHGLYWDEWITDMFEKTYGKVEEFKNDLNIEKNKLTN